MRKEDAVAEGMMRLVRAFYRIRLSGRGRASLYDPSYWALWMLLEGDMPISELGRKLGRSKPSMTALVDKLVSEGKVRRVRGREDRRVVFLSITGEGREQLSRKKAQARDSIRKALSALDERQMGRLRSSLDEVERIFTRVIV